MADNRTKTIFVSNIADVSLSHLLELMTALGSYRKGLVLVGGWVPYLLLREYQNKTVNFQHVGSVDIDIAVNPEIVDEKKYATMLELLQKRGYRTKEGTTFSFVKTVITNKGEEQIQIDFLGPEYGGTKKGHRHQVVQDNFLLRKAHGADIVFDHALNLTLEGRLPSGGEGKTTIKVADVVGSLTMKGIVMGSRYKEKDAYDITSLILYYKNGPLSVADEIRPVIEHGLVKEALNAIRDRFRSQEAEGPTWFADFQEAIGDVREQLKTQAYLQVQRFLLALYEPPRPPQASRNTVGDNTPVLDIEPSLGGRGGSAGHFVHFYAINTGEKVAIDCQWGIRGFAYEWRSPEVFTLRPDEKKKLEYKISDEKLFNEFVPELNIFFEYKDNKGISYFTRRELVIKKVPSDAFYSITKVGSFHPAVVLSDPKIRSISEPYRRDNLIVKVDVEVEVDGKIKNIQVGISQILLQVFNFSDEELKAAFAELVMRIVVKMLREGILQDYIFRPGELPKDKPLAGFEAYRALRDGID